MSRLTLPVILARAVLALALWTSAAQSAQPLSARGLCSADGGTVQETGNPDVHICCYSERQRCLVVDDRSRSSVRVAFPRESAEASPDGFDAASD